MPVSMRIHEPLELLAISGVAEIFHEFREFALGGNKLLAFFFQPREFSGAPFVEGAISGRAHAKAGGAQFFTAKPLRSEPCAQFAHFSRAKEIMSPG
jgi:hypothetical protein